MLLEEKEVKSIRQPRKRYDLARAEAFQERLAGMLNSAALTLMMSIGHRTGLFDAMARMRPATSPQIAEAAGLNERYVREWLGAMVTGGFIEYEPHLRTYRLPPEHAAALSRSAAPNNVAVVAQFVPVLASVEDDIVRCFREGGGVPYERYNRFHEVMAEESGQTVGSALFENVLPLVPEVCERLEAGAEVLDVGCGRGRALILLAQRFPASRFTGYDLCADAVAAARADADRLGLTNVRFETRDVADLREVGRYDFITAFDAIHDQARPASVLREIRAALRPGGVFLMQDIRGSTHLHENLGNPLAPLFYTISCLHCMSVSLSQGGEGLGAMWGKETALDMLRAAGFSNVRVRELEHDVQNYWYVCRTA